VPTFVNNNSTASRVADPDNGGKLRRILAGQTVDATGGFADALTATPGFDTADSGDTDAWQERVDANNAAGLSEGPALRAQAKGMIPAMRQALRSATIAGPLRVVVGDTMAPYGPDNGVVTTKAEAASASDLDRVAFADHEALPGERVEGAGEAATAEQPITAATTFTEAEIHNAQESNAVIAEEAAQAYIEGVPALTPRASGEGAPEPTEPTGGDQPGLTGPYDQYSTVQLKGEAARRGLPVGGTKAELVTRLDEDDAP
jgi:hypothetical protein